MLRVAFCQRRRQMAGQRVNTAAHVNTFVVKTRPRALRHRRHARQNAVSHLAGDLHHAAIVKHVHDIPGSELPRAGVNRVQPHLIRYRFMERQHVGIGRVGMAFGVEAAQL